ncbi:MAG: tRNA preQ1(34) S-adenosylmethionine ribosyltransferase-isomerase QueA [Erysipelotrichaceae bacterium]|nr:tRNA preQ1(34) S-adenosylmethionine ribosyltransferase-isomerase QueA [Erysipelotrichaceae bacterium]MDY5252052.1 tRNA preQ1(34) S-adenosylmethionine ribosyltransferase-isomerase QueA [Erysipelotrichaceae bacterium]
MKTSEFDFYLPETLIAQHPSEARSNSRLLVVHKNEGTFEHKHFYDIVDYFKEGDVLVRNNTRVIPARLYGTKEITNAHVELLLLKQEADDVWECLVGNAKVVKLGTVVAFNEGELKAQCVEVKDKGIRRMKMIYDGIFMEVLEKLGNVPLPPYIKEKLDDPSRYQTVYAKVDGSAAAPTAGLHFTEEIFAQLKQKGVTIVDVTLHIGLGTFKPMDTENVEDHIMHSEYYEMSQETADILNNAKANHQRIISVGTTSTRTLEAIYKQYRCFKACSGQTDIFIFPGYKWEAIDCIITNFHLPKSTLIMMISSFAGKDLIFKAYHEAVEKQYRFFSFGDSMFITNE